MSDRPMLQRGSSGDYVEQVQSLLARIGYDSVGSADAVFGPATEVGVRAFQGDKGLVVDGIVGPNTWAAIEDAAGFGGQVL